MKDIYLFFLDCLVIKFFIRVLEDFLKYLEDEDNLKVVKEYVEELIGRVFYFEINVIFDIIVIVIVILILIMD